MSYRFMPVVQWNPYDFIHFRYLYEFDFIPESSRRKDREDNSHPMGNETEQETALYIRLIGKGFSNETSTEQKNLSELIEPLSYELKIATGIGNERFSTKSKWNLSYEHHLFWDLNDSFALRYSISRSDGEWGLQTIGLSYKF